MAFACNSSGVMTILAGKNDESVVKIISSEDHPVCYEEVDGETVDPFKIDADTLEGKSVQDIVDLVPSPDLSGYAKSAEVESLKTSVSEGKKLVAAAVTDKGVNTAADSTFQVIANNISSISMVQTKSLEYANGLLGIYPGDGLSCLQYNHDSFTTVYCPTNINYSNGNRTDSSIAVSIAKSSGATQPTVKFVPSGKSGYNLDLYCRFYASQNKMEAPSGTNGCPYIDSIDSWIGDDGRLHVRYNFSSYITCTGNRYVEIRSSTDSIYVTVNNIEIPITYKSLDGFV